MTATTAAADIGFQERRTPSGQNHTKRQASTEDSSPFFEEFMGACWRGKKLIIVVTCLALVGGWFALSALPPLYTAEARIKIGHAAGPDARNFQFESPVILSEVEVLRSRKLVGDVIRSSHLASDPELNTLLMEKGPVGDGADQFKALSLQMSKTHQVPEMKDIPEGRADRMTGVIIDNFLKNLHVEPVDGSHVIKLEYTSHHPEKAAVLANAVIETYMGQYRNAEQSPQAASFEIDDEKLFKLQKKMHESERAVMDFRHEKALGSEISYDVASGQFSELQAHLVAAEVDYAEALARLTQIEEAGKDPHALSSFTDVLHSDVVAQLTLRQADVSQKLSVLSERYGAKHPKIIRANKEYSKLQSLLENEIEKVVEGIENEMKILGARIAALKSSLNRLDGVMQKYNQDLLRLQDLVRQAETDRMIYESFLRMQQNRPDGIPQGYMAKPEVSVLSYASVPEKPSFPDMPRYLTLIGLLSVLLTALFAYLREALDHSFKSGRELEDMTGYPCLARIPELEIKDPVGMADYILEKPSSILAESVRSLRTILKLHAGRGGKAAKVVTITSSFPGEGKTTLSAWLARTAAKSGEKVIVIDGDLRRPSIQNILPGRGAKTLVEYLTDQAKLEDVIVKDSATGLHKIYARAVPNSALDLIDSDKMKNLMTTLRKVYDLVIIDTPACHAVTDANVLALLSDYTLYCIHWNKTHREAVAAGLRQFTNIGHEEIAFVLTNVDIYQQAAYGHGGIVYYDSETEAAQ